MASDSRWRHVAELFDLALQRRADERRAWLAEACPDDESLRREVRQMLAAHDRSAGILERGAVDVLSAPPPAGAIVGRRVGPYEVLREIGRGGMGVVYQARDSRLGRHVALKFLSPAVTGRPPQSGAGGRRSATLEARFLTEAKAASSLDHANICTIYDVGESDDGLQYIAMAYYEGETLAARIARGPLPVSDVVGIAIQAAEGLGRAHEAGIVHRDVKPSNLLLTERGVVKILDFGIARLEDSILTQPGDITGTFAYMSPEQALGQRVGPETDLWSLGVVLYEMLTGRRPFTDQRPDVLIRAILERAPPTVADLRPEVPPALERVIAKALAKLPAERPASAAELARDLAALRDPGTSPAPAGGAATPAAAPPVAEPRSLTQEIRFCTTADGVDLAYATTGAGPPLVKAANWLNHLEHDWQSPVWRHLIAGLARDRLLVRYDERGNGLSTWDVEEFSLEVFVRDLESVVDALGLERFALLGISQGAAVSIAYAVRYPQRVSHLVLHGGYPTGWRLRGSAREVERREALATLMLHGWGEENPAFRQLFTSLYVPAGNDQQIRWFNDLQRVSTSPENAVRLWRALGRLDVRPLLGQVTVPTLVLHSRDDAVVPFSEGRRLATAIAGARFVQLDSRNHLILEQEDSWPRFLSEIRSFLRS